MAASLSSWSARRINTSVQNYHHDPLRRTNRGASSYSSPSLPAFKLDRSFPISTTNLQSSGRRRTGFRPVIANASSKKSSEISIHQSHRGFDIITFIWNLAGVFTRFFKKEEELLDEIEEDIIMAADVIKEGAKVVEEVAEGLEEVAELVERAAKTIDKDAKKVDEIMDEVKTKTKTTHDELEEVVGSLQGSIEVVEKDITQVKAKVKKSKEESVSDPSIEDTPPSQEEESREPMVNNQTALEYNSLKHLSLAWTGTTLFYGFLKALRWLLILVHFRPPSSLVLRTALLFGTLLAAYFSLSIGAMPTNTLTT